MRVRRIGSDAVEGLADSILTGCSLGVEAVDAGGSGVRIESVSSRVGVEEAETKLSLDDLEAAVEGLPSRPSPVVGILDSS